ncbi:MAG: translation initiation factor IF-2 [Bacteroidota bacterium]
MSEDKSKRLGQIAREFNIGINTIVEFLAKKGHKVDPSPNTKISSEPYALIAKEYQSEKTVKESAGKLLIDAPHETISISDKQHEEPKEVKIEPEQHELSIKSTVIEKEHKPAPQIEKIEIEKPLGPKVLGKIDLTPKAPSKPPVEVVAPPPVVEVVEPIAKIELPSPIEEKPLIEEIIDFENTNEYLTQIDQIKIDQPNIIGKMDLSSLNQKTKPAKKSKDEIQTEKNEKKIKEAAEKAKPKSKKATEIPVPDDIVIPEDIAEEIIEELIDEAPIEAIIAEPFNFLKTKFNKLDGPKILGRMDLPIPKDPNRKPDPNSAEEKNKAKKKKRKRIPSDTPIPVKSTPPPVKPAPNVKPKTDDKKAKFVKKDKTEYTTDEIDKQIKETLARLSPSGKSKASKYRRIKRDMVSQHHQDDLDQLEQDKSTLKVTEFLTANELATLMNVQVNQIISTCLSLGLFVSINQRLDAETIALLTEEYGYKVQFVTADSQEDEAEEADDPKDLLPRAPIVTVMGHVDHGKTSLLDYIRKTNVIAGEAGGITQHIGAYEVTLPNGKQITFLDTPGHEAFTAMRARGAKITDVVIIMVAADDSIMPQTIEAINHAQAAGVPMVFAINKIDKENANIEKIKEGLSHLNILVEDWGGKYQSQEISAKKGLNIELLLEKVLLEAELLEVKANPDRLAVGTVIESSLDKGRGYVVKLLVQNGTLKMGDMVLAGSCYGKVKAMYNERNQSIKSAGPSTPLLLLGLNDAPQAGDTFKVMRDEQQVKSLANKRQQLIREQGLRTQKHITLDEIGRRIAIGDFKELNIIVKGDVDGSIEALSDSLLKLTSPEVQVNVIHKSVGQVTESDVLLASASNAIIVGFQVRPSPSARKLAEQEQIDIRLYSIIYNAINEIKLAIEGMLSPDIEEKILCNIEVREVFRITKVGAIAGCMVLDGKITRNTRIRLIRDGIVIYTGKLGSLKRFKDDAKEVSVGMECGLNIESFNDIKIGDIIEGYEQIETRRKL